LKPLLMDQGKLAGLGNIYTDEALWRARLHPLRPADSLSRDEVRALARAIRSVLRQAIRDRGSSVNNFVAPDGSLGRYQERHAVYQRQGEACPRCRSPIERIRLQGRGTHFCPRCQRAPRTGVGHAA
jgi:formamidopyrimidine-DNA glycosylase